MPSFLQLDEDIVIIGSGPQRIYEKGTLLEVLRSQPVNGELCLICGDQGREITLKPAIRANLSAVRDDKQYTLKSLVESMQLPKCIQVYDYTNEDIALDTKAASELTVKLAGKLKVWGIKAKEFYVASVKQSCDEQGNATFSNLLISQELGESEQVEVKHFNSRDAFDRYATRNFPMRKDFQYIHKALFSIPFCEEGRQVTFVRDPAVKLEGKYHAEIKKSIYLLFNKSIAKRSNIKP